MHTAITRQNQKLKKKWQFSLLIIGREMRVIMLVKNMAMYTVVLQWFQNSHKVRCLTQCATFYAIFEAAGPKWVIGVHNYVISGCVAPQQKLCYIGAVAVANQSETPPTRRPTLGFGQYTKRISLHEQHNIWADVCTEKEGGRFVYSGWLDDVTHVH